LTKLQRKNKCSSKSNLTSFIFRYETLKTKVKTNETDDIKFIKTISMETREQYNKSPINRPPKLENDRGILKSLKQARNERKAPLHGSRGNKRSFETEERKDKPNRTPSRQHRNVVNQFVTDDVPSIKKMHNNSESLVYNFIGFISSNIVTTTAPRPPITHRVTKSVSDFDKLVKDESNNDK
jgi:hypothetical protein